MKADVNDDTVRAWITRGFVADECKPAETMADLGKSRSVAEMHRAFQFLKFDCRDEGLSEDLNLAAAENYAFIRFAASATGDKGTEYLPGGYYALKKAADAVGLLQVLKQSDEPVSKPHPDVLRWGKTGVAHGLRDYKKRTGQEPAYQSSSLKLAWEVLSKTYGEVLSKTSGQ
ncbi:MAG: hypothetical protein KAH11_10015 [Rhodospirillales bacterium]|nr:hypothetical protein [Rhodospirillales bacterium]